MEVGGGDCVWAVDVCFYFGEGGGGDEGKGGGGCGGKGFGVQAGCYAVDCYVVFVYGVDGISALDLCEGMLGTWAIVRAVRAVADIGTCQA